MHDHSSDLILGRSSIARYLGATPRQVRHLQETQSLPIFALGGSSASTRSAIDAWIRERATAAWSSPTPERKLEHEPA